MRTIRLLSIFCLLLGSPTGWAKPLKVLLDPGHGGIDQGAHSAHHKEAALALQISLKLAELLKNDPEFQVSLTRTTDTFLSLEERAELSATKKADVFISIHLNSSTDKKASGKEIYFQNQLPPDEESLYLANLEKHGLEIADDASESSSDVHVILQDLQKNHRIFQSSRLSECLHRNWQGQGPKRKRPIRQAPFHVVSKVEIPSVLVEVGYLSNRKEAARLAEPEYQKRIAKGMHLGLKEYKDLVDKQTSTNLH